MKNEQKCTRKHEKMQKKKENDYDMPQYAREHLVKFHKTQLKTI